MDSSPNGTLSAAAPTTTTALNDTVTNRTGTYPNHNWEFLVAVLVSAISVSIIIALLAKCQVIRRYLASYRHTRLREADSFSQCDQASVPRGLEMEYSMHGGWETHSVPPVTEEDDDGFIEDNYIPASERARAERAAENMEETEEEMDEIEFSIA